jgi:hypothetical protein
MLSSSSGALFAAAKSNSGAAAKAAQRSAKRTAPTTTTKPKSTPSKAQGSPSRYRLEVARTVSGQSAPKSVRKAATTATTTTTTTVPMNDAHMLEADDDALGDAVDIDTMVHADGDDEPAQLDDEPEREDDDHEILTGWTLTANDVSADLDATFEGEDDEDDEHDAALSAGGRKKPPAEHPAAAIVREFQAQVAQNRVTFHVVMDALQKLSMYDRPRFMQHVIRAADTVPTLTERQRMRMRYPLIGLHLLHERFDKALPLLEATENLQPLEASLSAVIVILLTSRMPAALTAAMAIDKLMRKSNCKFSPRALSLLLIQYCRIGDAHEVDVIYERIVKDGVAPSYHALGSYICALPARKSAGKVFDAAYRARRLGVVWSPLVYSMLIVTCCDLHQLDRAVSIFDAACREGQQPTVVAFERLMHLCAQQGDVVLIDELVRWMSKYQLEMTLPMYEALIRLECRRGRVSSVVTLFRATLALGVPLTQEKLFVAVVNTLLSVDQRETAQALLTEAVKTCADAPLDAAIAIVALAFGSNWRGAIAWLREIRACGATVSDKTFASVILPLKGDVQAANAFVATMRETRVVPLPHVYRCAMRVTRADVAATTALFRQMIDVDGLEPSSLELVQLVRALVDADQRSEAMRMIAVVRSFGGSELLTQNVYAPLLEGGPVGNARDRELFALDSSGKPAARWVVALLADCQERAGARELTPTFFMAQLAAVLFAEQRLYDLMFARIDAVDRTWPRQRLACYAAVMNALVRRTEHDLNDESLRVSAETALTVFERVHKFALIGRGSELELPIVRRASAFHSSFLDDPAPAPAPSDAAPPPRSGPLDDLVAQIVQRPATTSVSKPACEIWTAAIRACEIARLDKQRAALQADWEKLQLV